MTEYCTDDDLVAIRPDILDLGVSSWEDQISKAGKIIDRTLESNWYRAVAAEHNVDHTTTPFDREKLISADSDQCKDLCVYKTLELAYLYLSKNRTDDPFDAQRKVMRQLYADELQDLMLAGISYDWSDDGTVDSEETLNPKIRRLERC